MGNFEKPYSMECFDIYIRGVGAPEERDESGRVLLFRKSEKLKVLIENFEKRMLVPYDKIVLLAAGYCDSIEMEKAQEHWLKENAHRLPKKWKNAHEHPCEIPERLKDVQAAKDKAEIIPNGTKMLCRNWGCGEHFEYTEDAITSKVLIRFLYKKKILFSSFPAAFFSQ